MPVDRNRFDDEGDVVDGPTVFGHVELPRNIREFV
jgi:hypothetical protein